MGAALERMVEQHIGVEGLQQRAAAEAAVARVNLDGPPDAQSCARIKMNTDILDVQVVQL